jgi:putative heme-binding domain-containing protein
VLDRAAAADLLAALLDPAQPLDLQRLAASSLATLGDAPAFATALERWPTLGLDARRTLLSAAAGKAALAFRLLDAVEREEVAPSEVDPATRDALLRLPDADGLHARVASLLGRSDADRVAVVERYRAAVAARTSPPDGARGAALFAQHCLTCHAVGGRGANVGPGLDGVSGRPREALVDDVLHPGREVSPDHLGFVAATRSGRLVTGLLVAESPQGVTLRAPGGIDETIPRAELEGLQSTGRSLMPEGFESSLDPDQLDDLIHYLRDPARFPLPPAG